MRSFLLLVPMAVLALAKSRVRNQMGLLNDNELHLGLLRNAVGKAVLDPEEHLPTPKLIRGRGYPCEEHQVITEDGYVLTMHRVPHGRRSTALGGPAVLLQHGMLCSSADWAINPTNKGLAYMLADSGYDVWLGNVRGNTYSRRHLNMSSDSDEFWQFSWDEMGYYDLPAMVDTILESTGQRQVRYVAHSMGTTMLWVGLDRRPQLRSKVAVGVALAPVAFTKSMKSPVRLLAPWANQLNILLDLLGHGELLPHSKFMTFLQSVLCEEVEIQLQLCSDLLFLIVGFDLGQVNMTLLPSILGHTPAGTSGRTVVHYAQEVRSGKFCRYDYGKKGNMIHYGLKTPPEYDLSKVDIPVALFWSDHDWLADYKDVQRLKSKLPNLFGSFRVDSGRFNHLDFLWGKDVDRLLYNQVLHVLSFF